MGRLIEISENGQMELLLVSKVNVAHYLRIMVNQFNQTHQNQSIEYQIYQQNDKLNKIILISLNLIADSKECQNIVLKFLNNPSNEYYGFYCQILVLLQRNLHQLSLPATQVALPTLE